MMTYPGCDGPFAGGLGISSDPPVGTPPEAVAGWFAGASAAAEGCGAGCSVGSTARAVSACVAAASPAASPMDRRTPFTIPPSPVRSAPGPEAAGDRVIRII
ncbi:MAG TPA: hypothetical protein VM683_08955 [Anaeromyxobacteraceae bacterium]|nr:hypothetical protein [Anaeromyxobacteraceae bacterium]